MKQLLKQALALASFALLSATASAQITNTPHNLTSTGTGPNKQSTTAQICVFCHTPHASNTAVSAPLWNKGMPNPVGGYQVYSTSNSSTIDGEALGVGAGSVSAACLSCHDGTQAMDNLVNAPGTGGLTAGTSRGYAWTGSNVVTGVAALGADLTNDHPVGIEYCGGGLSNGGGTTLNGTCNDGGADGPNRTFNYPITAVINGTPVFWVDTGTAANARDKGDIILYSRNFAAGNNTPSVECASCHDPHKAKGSDDVHFMRVTTAGSQICLACHVK